MPSVSVQSIFAIAFGPRLTVARTLPESLPIVTVGGFEAIAGAAAATAAAAGAETASDASVRRAIRRLRGVCTSLGSFQLPADAPLIPGSVGIANFRKVLLSYSTRDSIRTGGRAAERVDLDRSCPRGDPWENGGKVCRRGREDSNPRLLVLETSVLPTELLPRGVHSRSAQKAGGAG
jgi:hypothetical protein